MSLLTDAFTACRILNETRRSDGSGGYTTSYTEGAALSAAISLAGNRETRSANRPGAKATFTITVKKNTGLKYNQVIKRMSDGKLFRVTSNRADNHTPAAASFQYEQVTAEEWSLT